MSDKLYKPSTRGLRAPLDNGSHSDRIVNPPRMAQYGGLTSTRKGGPKNTMAVRKPGQTER